MNFESNGTLDKTDMSSADGESLTGRQKETAKESSPPEPNLTEEGVVKPLPPQPPTFPDGGREAWIVSRTASPQGGPLIFALSRSLQELG